MVGTKGTVIEQSEKRLVIWTDEGRELIFDKNDPSIDPMVDVLDFYVLVN